MPPAVSPILRRRRLGVELRKLREAAGLTGDQVIERIGWASASKLSRLENGRSRPDLRDVLDLLDLYGASGTARDEISSIAEAAGDMRGWLKSYQVMTPMQRSYAELEAGCAEIREYSPTLVPGLLQTPAYARVRIVSTRSLISDADGPGEIEDPDTEVAARMSRQLLITDQTNHPRYTAVLEEAAFSRRAGPPDMLRDQLSRLCELAELPNVTLRLLLRDTPVGNWYLPPTAFSLYRFADPLDPETLAVEGDFTNFMHTDTNTLNRYKVAFEWLRSAALSPSDTLSWLVEARNRAADGPGLSTVAYGSATAPVQRRRHSGRLTER